MKNKFMVLFIALAMLTLTALSVSAANSCVNAYTYSNGSQSFNVTAGNVCINSTSYDADPTAAVNCGIWSQCVAGAFSAPQFYVGYTATGTGFCTATGWVASGLPAVNYPYGLETTQNVDTCTTSGYTGNGYTKSDFKDIVVDGMGTVGASLVEWLDLIILLVVLGFILGLFVKLANMFK